MRSRDYAWVRSRLLERAEVALLDVREEAAHATGHPLFAANLPLGRLELDALTRLPRRDVPIATFDGGEGVAERAAERLAALGFIDVGAFAGGVEAWRSAGGEVFIDVNVPSKAFGELLESVCHTPSLTAESVRDMLDRGDDVLVVDVRRPDEYRTMSIPSGINVPGAELVSHAPDLVPTPETLIVVNCAGRTRSLVGTQSLINAGLPNEVAALRNGTIGWMLAGLGLETGATRTFGSTSAEAAGIARQRARAVADRAGVGRATTHEVDRWAAQHGRTTYFFDVRSPAEYERGHVPGFVPIAGGQLVQETDMHAPVRGARIVLADDDGSRANMTASWLAQMAWDVYVLDGLGPGDFQATGPWQSPSPPLPETPAVAPATLRDRLDTGRTIVVDLARHAVYRTHHVQGAWWALRSDLETAVATLPPAPQYVLTSGDGVLARFAAAGVRAQVAADVVVLDGGTDAWIAAGFATESGDERLASPALDRYRRPYEGVDAPRAAMQAYLDWEFGLVAQLARDGTHHFVPLQMEVSRPGAGSGA